MGLRDFQKNWPGTEGEGEGNVKGDSWDFCLKQWGEGISGEKGGLGEGNEFGRLLKYILEVLETDSFLISLPINSVSGSIPYEN